MARCSKNVKNFPVPSLKRYSTYPLQAPREGKKYQHVLRQGLNNGSMSKKQMKFNLTPEVHDVEREEIAENINTCSMLS